MKSEHGLNDSNFIWSVKKINVVLILWICKNEKCKNIFAVQSCGHWQNGTCNSMLKLL